MSEDSGNSGNGDDPARAIRVSGTEHHVLPFELPTGSVIVGVALVIVRETTGDVEALHRCHARGRADRQAYYNVMAMALEDFRHKHELAEGGGDIRLNRKR